MDDGHCIFCVRANLTVAEVDLLQNLLAQSLQQHLPKLEEKPYLPFGVAGRADESEEKLAFVTLCIFFPAVQEANEPAIGFGWGTVFAKLPIKFTT